MWVYAVFGILVVTITVYVYLTYFPNLDKPVDSNLASKFHDL